MTRNINLLTAVRCGELHPAMLARTIATLDHILSGRLTINIISSDMPGEHASSESRYQRSREVIEILKQAWTQDHIDFKGEFYDLKLETTEPVRPYQQNGGPLLYFGGYSDPGKDLCAEHCDVYLMWPDSEEDLRGHMEDVSKRAAAYGRQGRFRFAHPHDRPRDGKRSAGGSRKARFAAGRHLRRRDSQPGAGRQDARRGAASRARERSDAEGYVEPHVWTGIGGARSGCGAALVGDPDQILAKIQRYIDMGMRGFIFSGYPHLDECKLFARYVLPQLQTVSLPQEQGRIPATTPRPRWAWANGAEGASSISPPKV